MNLALCFELGTLKIIYSSGNRSQSSLGQSDNKQRSFISGKVSHIRDRTDFSPKGTLMKAQKATGELAIAETIEAALLVVQKYSRKIFQTLLR